MSFLHSHDGCCHAGTPFVAPDRAFRIGILLNALFIVVEVIWGLKANSLALLADAGHNASDVVALAIAWGASALSRRTPSAHFTYGWRGSSILASLSNAVFLLLVMGALAWEAVLRLAHLEPAEGKTIIIVALLGCVINAATAWLFFSGQRRDINIRGAYLHMAADAAVSLGTAAAGGLILATGWLWLDPAVSLLVTVAIVAGTWGLLRQSLRLALQAVPEGIDPAAVRAVLAAEEGVREVHDLHIWGMSTTENACSAHLVMPGGHPGDAFLRELSARLQQKFDIGHATFQIEMGDSAEACPLAPDHVV